MSAQALVWPVDRESTTAHLGYTASASVYLFGSRANGADIWIDTGTATVQAGLPGDVWFRTLSTVHAGSSFHVSGVGFGEVLSVQSDQPFSYRIIVPPPTPPAGGPPVNEGEGTTDAGNSVTVALRSRRAELLQRRLDGRDHLMAVGVGAPGQLPSGQPGATGLRVGRHTAVSIHGPVGRGCEVTGTSGITRVIEWQHGASQWRDTWLYPGSRTSSI